MRTGIYGGTFDPIHIAHLRMAVEVRELFALDKVLLIPCHYPPHKAGQPGASAKDRLAMVELAVENTPGLESSDMEVRQGGTSYTVTTLEALKGPEQENFFILGLDAFLEIHTWKNYENLFSLAHFVVLSRPWNQARAELFHMEQFVRNRLSHLVDPVSCDGKFAVKHTGNHLFFAQTTAMDISATRIRETVAMGKSIDFLVPATIENYIRKAGLYI
ncbi:MAG: nicotinate-nucleotide adenylyltransferase [Desulfatibacillum sp.]|nr:nicotinate-nucleotide adenylyltransferase [Desulfatibacillum sp.]